MWVWVWCVFVGVSLCMCVCVCFSVCASLRCYSYNLLKFCDCKLRFREQADKLNLELTDGVKTLSDAYSQKIVTGLPKANLS